MRPDDGRIVPEFCIQALTGKPLTLHGDGKQTRSFCYVSDSVDGIVRLFESDMKDAGQYVAIRRNARCMTLPKR